MPGDPHLDGHAIERIVLTVARRSDDGRIDDVVAAFTDDAVLDTGARQVHGRDGLLEFFGPGRTSDPDRQRSKHVISNVVVDVDGDRATAWSYFQVLRSAGLVTWGRYVDTLRETDGAWRIAARRVIVDGQQPKPS